MNKLIPKFAIVMLVLSAVSVAHAVASDKDAPPPVLASPTLEVNFPFKESFIQFFSIPQVAEPSVEVYLSYRSDSSVETTHLETIEPEGRSAQIESVFTFDADRDRKRELFVIVSWPVNHAAIGTEGALYKIYVYRSIFNDASEWAFQRAEDIEEKLGSGFDGKRDGVRVTFPYKDYAAIRSALAH